MVKIIEVGERSGTLDKSMEDLTEYFDYEVTNSLHYFVTLLEPLILVAVGVIVGGMMMAIIAPIYNLIGQVGSVR
jgi:type II secretory pathway component PulF